MKWTRTSGEIFMTYDRGSIYSIIITTPYMLEDVTNVAVAESENPLPPLDTSDLHIYLPNSHLNFNFPS
jgi:hypothetical protein